MRNLIRKILQEDVLKTFEIEDQPYWFEVRDPKDEKGYSVGWGIGDVSDENFTKYRRTEKYHSHLVFGQVGRLFKDWFDENRPKTFYFSVPGEKRMRIYINGIKKIVGDGYEYEIKKTDYKPFDVKETSVYYVIFDKK